KAGGSAGKSGSSGKSGSTGKGGSGSPDTIPAIGKPTPIKSTPITSGGSTKSASTYSNGGGKIYTISSGLFAGRKQGGATRGQVWGTRSYGSGYPGYYSRGVDNRGFPFYFWPVSWGPGVGYGPNAGYMHTPEYGAPDNTSRPGGPMAFAIFQSNATANGTTFRLVADNYTVGDLLPAIITNCSQYLTPASNVTLPTLFNNASAMPEPEQAVQYYRASSVALDLDGYNNSAVFAAENSTADTPLPSGIDSNLLGCLNYTIGQAVPLVDGAPSVAFSPSTGFIGLVALLLFVFNNL
ncbi:hypothetical protein C8R47DRAFT_914488, partial [Mycena vitilis]